LVTIHSFPRLHVGLLDLGHATHRHYGGAGFYVDGLPVEIQVTRSREMRLLGLEQLDREGQRDLRNAITRTRALLSWPKLTIQLRNVPQQHVGLGSKTATILGTLKAINLICRSPLENRTVQKLSNRGGTSGIGVNAFFSGGFLVDCGHAASGKQTFAPSSRRTHFSVPPCGLPGSDPRRLAISFGLAIRPQISFQNRSEILPAEHAHSR